MLVKLTAACHENEYTIILLGKETLFQTNNNDLFHLSGMTMLFLNINQPPTGGSCTVTPTRGTAMIDKYGVMCTDWLDPENQGIQYYTIACTYSLISIIHYKLILKNFVGNIVLVFQFSLLTLSIVINCSLYEIATSSCKKRLKFTFMR